MDPENKRQFISPLWGESIQANKKAIQKVRYITSLTIGVGAGILRLESYWGFLFYVIMATIVSVLLHYVLAEGKPAIYFLKPTQEVWINDVLSGLSSFVLSWTLFYGLVDA